ncbi:hypothetical protein BV97_01188 [Novosphingobium resinovorum]|uniref:Uncharacterized protein n=1 Tax=Novosphingobium resinovorum TaxID=158500 RepID=A0A031K420_9SPHN|nr:MULTISPECIES: hypothetical protein [Novosphingobium]EZP83995.1 hypothetical protein BV97_01188 [Novosphingobium resinovorum]
MRIILFLACLLGALGYAAWRGGGPERAMSAIALAMVGTDGLLHRFVSVEFAAIDMGHLAIDLFGASSTVLLALCAYRFWPMFAAVLHLLPLLAHSTRLLDVTLHPAAYLTMQVAPSWLVPPLLVVATWQHQRRLRRSGNDRSWHVLWPRWNPTMRTR